MREGEKEGAEAFGVHGGKVLGSRVEVQGVRGCDEGHGHTHSIERRVQRVGGLSK
jgi:hypothetical protein